MVYRFSCPFFRCLARKVLVKLSLSGTDLRADNVKGSGAGSRSTTGVVRRQNDCLYRWPGTFILPFAVKHLPVGGGFYGRRSSLAKARVDVGVKLAGGTGQLDVSEEQVAEAGGADAAVDIGIVQIVAEEGA